MNENIQIEDTDFDGLKIINRKIFADTRGIFKKLFCFDVFSNINIKQVNFSSTQQPGTVRGMHFQYFPVAEIKVVTCLKGKIYDVVVDLRKDSKTFLKWFGIILDASAQKSLLIPKGFAHGFQCLEENSELIYFHSETYAPNFEGGVHPLDPKIGIKWPLKPINISERDQQHIFLTSEFKGLVYEV